MKRNLKNHPDLPSDFSLESLRDQNPFRVPDGYFDTLPQIIINRIEAKPVIKKSRRMHPGVFAAAASVVLMLGLALVMRTSVFNDNTTEIQLSSIPDTHIVNHLDNAITNGEIDEPILMDEVVKATTQDAKTASASSNQSQNEATGILPTVSDEAIIDYLVLNQSPTNTANDIAQKAQ